MILMRRFLYDTVLLILLVMIGLSITDADEVNKQEELDQFEEQIKTDEVVSEVEKKSGLNQIEENGASSFAKGTSDVLKSCVDFGVETLTSIFEIIIE